MVARGRGGGGLGSLESTGEGAELIPHPHALIGAKPKTKFNWFKMVQLAWIVQNYRLGVQKSIERERKVGRSVNIYLGKTAIFLFIVTD